MHTHCCLTAISALLEWEDTQSNYAAAFFNTLFKLPAGKTSYREKNPDTFGSWMYFTNFRGNWVLLLLFLYHSCFLCATCTVEERLKLLQLTINCSTFSFLFYIPCLSFSSSLILKFLAFWSDINFSFSIFWNLDLFFNTGMQTVQAFQYLQFSNYR